MFPMFFILKFRQWHFIWLHNLEETMPWESAEHNFITALIFTRYTVFPSCKNIVSIFIHLVSSKNDTRGIKIDYIFKISTTKIVKNTIHEVIFCWLERKKGQARLMKIIYIIASFCEYICLQMYLSWVQRIHAFPISLYALLPRRLWWCNG